MCNFDRPSGVFPVVVANGAAACKRGEEAMNQQNNNPNQTPSQQQREQQQREQQQRERQNNPGQAPKPGQGQNADKTPGKGNNER